MANNPQQAGQEARQKLGWFHTHRFLLLRRLTQLTVLSLFLSGPLFGLWVLRGNYSGSLFLDTVPMTDPLIFLQTLLAQGWPTVSTVVIGALIVALFYGLIAGKIYCGWVCPFNLVTDLAAWLRRKLRIQASLNLSNKLRYAVLLGILVGSAVSGALVWEWLNPITILGRGVITVAGEIPALLETTAQLDAPVAAAAGEFATHVATVAEESTAHSGVLVSSWRLLVFGFGAGAWMLIAIFIFDLLVVKNGWCGHLCPVGALYGVIGTFSLLHIKAEQREKCTQCMDCINVCPEPQVLPLPLFSKQSSALVSSSECLRCGRCIDICPENVFSIRVCLKKESKDKK